MLANENDGHRSHNISGKTMKELEQFALLEKDDKRASNNVLEQQAGICSRTEEYDIIKRSNLESADEETIESTDPHEEGDMLIPHQVLSSVSRAGTVVAVHHSPVPLGHAFLPAP